jgi:hypothetical protein
MVHSKLTLTLRRLIKASADGYVLSSLTQINMVSAGLFVVFPASQLEGNL